MFLFNNILNIYKNIFILYNELFYYFVKITQNELNFIKFGCLYEKNDIFGNFSFNDFNNNYLNNITISEERYNKKPENYKEYIINTKYIFQLFKTIGINFNDCNIMEMFNNSNYKSINSLKCFSLMSFEELRDNDMIFKKTGKLSEQPFSKKSVFEEEDSEILFKKIGEKVEIFENKESSLLGNWESIQAIFGSTIEQNNNYPSLFGDDSNKILSET